MNTIIFDCDYLPKVSIIMPIFNVENYLDKCLNSVRNQTLNDIEIICVNDGSTDTSLEIIKKHASIDSRIKVIDKKNSGYGHSLNVGFSIATGDYIGVVETDDYILPEMYDELYSVAIENNLDFIKSDHYKFEDNRNGGEIKIYTPLTKDKTYYNRVINPQEELGVFNLVMMTWSGIYSSKFINEKNIRHNETPGASFQDNGFWFQVFSQASRCYFVNKAYYMLRRDNPNSSVKSRNKVYAMCVEYEFIENFLKMKPGRMDKYKYIYQYHKCIAYHFTLKRISHEYVREFLLKFSFDFKDPMQLGLLRENDFSPIIWRYTKIIVKDPIYFYCWKYYDLRYERIEPPDVILRYYRIQQENIKKEIDNIKQSNSYKLCRGITFIPRKIKRFVTIVKNEGFAGVRKALSTYLFGNPDRKMKVLYIPSDNSSSSGAFLSMSTLCDILQTTKNIRTKVILPRSGNGVDILNEFCIQHQTVESFDWVVQLGEPRDRQFFIKKIRESIVTLAAAIQIASIIRKEKFDAVHINTTYAYVGYIAGKLAGKPVIWHLREFLEEDQGREIWCKSKGIRLISNADAVVAISHTLYEKYSPIISDRLQFIYNGIDTNRFYNERDILMSETPNFIFIGGLSERKGCFFLIDSLEEYYLRGHTNFKITFVGRESEKFTARIEKSIMRDNITCVGYQRNTETYYSKSDIAFTCSDSEAFGRITVEAMISGCLVIGVDSGCTKELIINHSTGLLYEKNNIDSVIDSINIALLQRDSARNIAKNGQKFARENLNADLNAEKINELYCDIIDYKKRKNPLIESMRSLMLCPLYLALHVIKPFMKTIDIISGDKMNKNESTNEINKKMKKIDALLQGTPENVAKGVELCKTLAESGIPEAQFKLAIIYKNDAKTPSNKTESIFWMKKAVESGSSKAIIGLIDLLSSGGNAEKKEAFDLAFKLSNENHSGAQYRLGLFYLRGIGTENDVNNAKIWLKKASRNGNKKSEVELVKILLDEKNYHDAYAECLISAENDNSDSMYYLSTMYEKGIGTSVNIEKSQKWMKLAAESGSNKAIIVLIDSLSNGNDDELKEAFTLCKKLADKDHLGAQYRLGVMYWKGSGVECNANLAREYLIKSSIGGYRKATEFIKDNHIE